MYTGKICDENCVPLFTKYYVKIYKYGEITIGGQRNRTNVLWYTPISPKTSPIGHLIPLSKNLASGAIKNVTTQSNLTEFLHGCAFSPFLLTLMRAIKIVHFASWTGLTRNLVNKHLTNSTATRKGHLQMEQKSIQPRS